MNCVHRGGMWIGLGYIVGNLSLFYAVGGRFISTYFWKFANFAKEI